MKARCESGASGKKYQPGKYPVLKAACDNQTVWMDCCDCWLDVDDEEPAISNESFLIRKEGNMISLLNSHDAFAAIMAGSATEQEAGREAGALFQSCDSFTLADFEEEHTYLVP